MWECSKCDELIEESFEVCWNCGTSQDGQEDPGFQPEGTPQDRDGQPEDARPAGVSQPCPWLIVGTIVGTVGAFITPRPGLPSMDEEIWKFFTSTPFWAPVCALLLLLGGVMSMGAFLRSYLVDRPPVEFLKLGPSWLKRVGNLPSHWLENFLWAYIGVGVGGLIGAQFAGTRPLFPAVLAIIAAAGTLLGFRLAARRFNPATPTT